MAQLVARSVRDAEVVGSSPITLTIFLCYNGSMEERPKNKKWLVIIMIVAFLALVVGLIVYSVMKMNAANDRKVLIDNLAECAPNISESSRTELETSLYGVVVSQNEIGFMKSASSYHAKIREDSCKTKNYSDSGRVTTTIIIDIPELQYSYKVRFDWISSDAEGSKKFDTLAPYVFCLPDDEMIYPDFGCSDNPAVSIEEDEITYLLPLIGDGYELTLVKSIDSKCGYAVIATIIPPKEVYMSGDPIAFRDERLAEIRKLLESYGLNLDNYVIRSRLNVD